MPDYKEYAVDASEVEGGMWVAEIRRKDGRMMRVQGTAMQSFRTMAASSSGEALKLAYQAIDGNQIAAAGWT